MTAAVADELVKHKQAYLQLFKSVLAKRPLDAAGREALLQKLSAHMNSVIKTTDDLIPRIPEFATILGVNPAQLSTFIGTNFLQALQFVSKIPASAPQEQKPPEKKTGNFLIDIVQSCPIQLPPDSRFILAETGFLKLITPKGEVPSQGLIASGDGNGNVDIQYEQQAAEAPAPSTQPTPRAGTAVAASQQPAAPRVAEKSILKEVLERFGSSLDIPGKLVPRDYISETDDVDEPETEEAEEEAPAAAAPGQSFKQEASPPVKKENSILKEVLEKFGNQLDIPEKLVPRSFADESAGEEILDSTDEEFDESESGEETTAVQNPIAFSFSNFLDVMKKLQDFQTRQDQDGYRRWLSSEAGIEDKILVAVRNFEKKEKAGGLVNWNDEYSNLSGRLGCRADYVNRVHEHLKSLYQVHSIWSSLMQAAKSAPAAQMEDLRRLWPQIKLLFDEGGTSSTLNSRLQILLLAIPDPVRKENTKQILEPYLKRLANV